MTARTFDPKSYELAAHFLQDEPELNTESARTTLAAEIQYCIECEIQFMRKALRIEHSYVRRGR